MEAEYAKDEAEVDHMLQHVKEEYFQARSKFKPYNSSHEGWAVIWEELDEMWDEVKANNLRGAHREALQVAATALAFLLEVRDAS